MKKSLIFLIAITCLFGANFVSAQSNYQPIISDFNIKNEKFFEQNNNIAGLFNDIFRISIMVLSGLAVLSIAYGGVQWMTSETPFKLGDAKSRITNAVWGLILALSAYTILYIINPQLTQINLDFSKLQSTPAPVNTNNVSATPATSAQTGTSADQKTPQTAAPSGSNPAVTDPASNLAANNIYINDPNRTSLKGMRTRTLDGITQIKKEADIDKIIITGGTEGGHSEGTYSHANGYKVDVSKNSNPEIWDDLSSYIKRKINNNNPSQNTNYSFTLENGIYTTVRLEPNSALHWDFLFQ